MSSYRRSSKRSRGYVRARSARRSRRPTRRMALRRGRGFTRRAGVYGRFLSTPRSELKVFDVNEVSVTGAPFTTAATGYIRSLISTNAAGIAQGSNAGERIGNKIVVKSVNVELSWQYNGATGSDVSGATVFIVYDKQPNGALASAVSVVGMMVNGAAAAATTPGRTGAFTNLFYSGRFVTLARVDFSCPSLSYGTVPFCGLVKHRVYKKVNLPIEYNGATGYDTTLQKGNLLIVAFAAGASNLLWWSSRTRYADV